jgi:DNA invertase Pin-like site-specific DNA recombinase
MLVGYMRVSSDGERQVLDLQRDALLAAGVDERHLFEVRVTGSRGTRDGLSKALGFLRPGDCLAVWKLDRLGRSLPHLLSTVNDLKARGVGFVSLTEQMDTTTPQGEFLLHIFGALAQFERALISGGSVYLNSLARFISGLRIAVMPLREAAGGCIGWCPRTCCSSVFQ